MPPKIVSSKKKKETARGGLSEWMPLIQVLAAFVVVGVILYFVITLPPGWPSVSGRKPAAASATQTAAPLSSADGPISEFDINMVGMCANKYWPVLEGSIWTYAVTYTDAAGTSTAWKESWILMRVDQSAEHAYQVTVSVVRGDERLDEVYTCNRDGFFKTRPDDNMEQLVLFSEQAMQTEQTWRAGRLGVTALGASPQTTPAGSFRTVGLNTYDGVQQENSYYAPGVGLVRRVVTGDAYGILEMILANFAVAQ